MTTQVLLGNCKDQHKPIPYELGHFRVLSFPLLQPCDTLFSRAFFLENCWLLPQTEPVGNAILGETFVTLCLYLLFLEQGHFSPWHLVVVVCSLFAPRFHLLSILGGMKSLR